MKKLALCLLALVLVLLSMAGCGAKSGDTPAPTTNDGNTSYTADGTVIPGSDPKTWGAADDGEVVRIPNPWVDCTSLEEAGKLAGFSFTAPDALEGYPEKQIAAIENEIAEVSFNDEDGTKIYFRKGVGTEDISGDYNVYKTTETRTIDGKTVTCKGNDGQVSNATWNDGTYAYSIMSTAGMDAQQLTAWVQSLG